MEIGLRITTTIKDVSSELQGRRSGAGVGAGAGVVQSARYDLRRNVPCVAVWWWSWNSGTYCSLSSDSEQLPATWRAHL
jgi:hypothetical protein